LFAAMNILEPLYEACIMRMRAFVEDEDRANTENKKNFSHKHKFFREVLENIQSPQHPNLLYFIYKNIILNNLYGVDIMKEAVEIAKLRLFLKLVATVEADYRKPNLGLEPLPDIDFNIRAGNTLVGFATETELNNAFAGSFDFDNDKEKVEEKCEIVALAFKRYKEIQLTYGDNFEDFKTAKEDLNNRLKTLNNELNQLLHKQASGIPYNTWLQTHQPFHWFAEFYEIVKDKGGFDVVIGNPPYLENRQINYIPDLQTFETGAVHNMCIERSLQILNKKGNISMIVPLALVCTQRMVCVQKMLEKERAVWYINFAWRPGKLFDTVNRALTIFFANNSDTKEVYSTNYQKWASEVRDLLFYSISFENWNEKRDSFWMPKINTNVEKSILSKVLKSKHSISNLIRSQTTNKVFYRTTGGLYWKIFTNFPPKFLVNGKEGKSSRETSFLVETEDFISISIALLSSNTFWWWYTITSNLRDLNPSDIRGFRFPNSVIEDVQIIEFGKEYLIDLEKNSEMLNRVQQQTGETQTQSFKVSLSKPIIDEIDAVLAEHYGFTEEELDFIINYDIKYRMGKELEGEDE